MAEKSRWYSALDEPDVAADGVNDDAPGLQRAIDKVSSGMAGKDGYGVGGTLVLPVGNMRLGTGLVVPSTIHLKGAGGYQTMLRPDPGIDALTVRGHSRRQRRWDVGSYDSSVTEMATRLDEFGVFGTNGDGQRGIIFESQCDRIRSYDLTVMNCDTGVIINEAHTDGASVMRESEFYSLDVDNCGTSNGDPALLITTQDTGGAASDGTNHVYFYGLRTLYNYGPVVISDDSADETLRRIQMFGWMLHGRGDRDELAWGDSCQIRSATDIQIHGLMTNSSKAGSACIRLMRGTGSDTGVPRNIRIQGSVGNSAGDGIVVEQAQALDLVIQQAGIVRGDDLRIEAGALTGKRHAHVRWLSHLDGSAKAPVINIDPGQRPSVYGHWNGVQRLDDEVEVIDAGGTARTLSVPAGGGPVTAI